MTKAQQIIDKYKSLHRVVINLSIRPEYYELLESLGNPQESLPPTFHVAGTNGKGSVCAFLRAILEASGYKVHVYTSPHLVNLNERIRIAGKLITDEYFGQILEDIDSKTSPEKLSYFEILTAAAFKAFSENKADFVILETGLGGRLDATNVIKNPLATIINRLSLDHRDFLGETIDKIAAEKAGIMKKNSKCFSANQPDALAMKTLEECAEKLGIALEREGKNWKYKILSDGFEYRDEKNTFKLPKPGLNGKHQYQNASLAIRALSVLKPSVTEAAVREGLKNVEWRGRLEKLEHKNLEIWLDGGHNDSAGEVLAEQIKEWFSEDEKKYVGKHKELYVILGMITTKKPAEFIGPFAEYIKEAITVDIPEHTSISKEELAEQLKGIKIKANTANSVEAAIRDIEKKNTGTLGARILICGSLYLAGTVLSELGCCV